MSNAPDQDCCWASTAKVTQLPSLPSGAEESAVANNRRFPPTKCSPLFVRCPRTRTTDTSVKFKGTTFATKGVGQIARIVTYSESPTRRGETEAIVGGFVSRAARSGALAGEDQRQDD